MSSSLVTERLEFPFFIIDSNGTVGGKYASLNQARSVAAAWDVRYPNEAPHFVFVSVDAPWALERMMYSLDGVSREELDSKTRLIAAAPELLEALKGLLELDDDHQRGADDQDVCLEVRKARAAIAKAEGKS